MKRKKTLLHIEEVKEGELSCSIVGSEDKLYEALTATLVSKPEIISVFANAVMSSIDLVGKSVSGEIDITKMMKVTHPMKGKH